MIKINDKEVSFVRHFNDGTQLIRFPQSFNIHSLIADNTLRFEWYYDSDEELLTLQYLVAYYKSVNTDSNVKFVLFVPYLPNARMDRVQEFFDEGKTNPKEVFTLKFFCDIINGMGFDSVITYDVHSNVAKSLLNNYINIDPVHNISHIIEGIRNSWDDKDFVVCFPDLGALKRYGSLPCFKKIRLLYGVKCRDWETSKITGMKVISAEGDENIDLKDTVVLVVDDIIGTGGTMSLVVKELKSYGADLIYLEASHMENCAIASDNEYIKPLLDDGTVSIIYTSNSILRKRHPNVHLFKNY